jgi:hypothetical protein
LLHQNIAANHPSNVTIMRRALRSSSVGEAVETVDQLALERLDVLKINSPASAVDLIRGAADTVWRLRPLLVLSVVDAADLASVKRSTSDFGYRAFRATFVVQPAKFQSTTRECVWKPKRNCNIGGARRARRVCAPEGLLRHTMKAAARLRPRCDCFASLLIHDN